MHILVLIQEMFPQSMFPNTERKKTREIQRFLDLICKKNYNAKNISPEWNKIRPREIKLFDFTIPESIEKEVIQDLMGFESFGLGNKIKDAMNKLLVQKLAKKFLGVVPIDRTGLVPTKYKWYRGEGRERPCVYLAIIGKYLDEHDENGVEQI